jgi:RNA polymerase sigma factor (sigma-70 family)
MEHGNLGHDPNGLVAKWGSSASEAFDPELRVALSEFVRRRVGESLRLEGLDAKIEPDRVAAAVASHFASVLGPERLPFFESRLRQLANEVLVDEEPGEVTRLLWVYNKDDPESEQRLYEALQCELRVRVSKILHRSSFTGLRYKIDQGDLVQELYLKLKSSGIPRLPENRRQFFALVDRATESILLDILKGAAAQKRPDSRLKQPVLDHFVDRRPAQDQLKMLLEAEEMLRLRENLKMLDVQQQEIFRLKSQGLPLTEIAEIVGVSISTVKRDLNLTIEFLRRNQ